MKIKEIIEENKGNYYNIEVYKFNSNNKRIHTDFINYLEDYNTEDEVEDYVLMDEEEYDTTILANSTERANFEEWYDNKDAKVLVIIKK